MFVKDVGAIADLADRLGPDLPVLTAVRPLHDRAVERGLASADAAALFEVLAPTGHRPEEERG